MYFFVVCSVKFAYTIVCFVVFTGCNMYLLHYIFIEQCSYKKMQILSVLFNALFTDFVILEQF